MRIAVVIALLAWLIKILFQPTTKNQKPVTNLEHRTLNIELFLLLFLFTVLISSFTSIYKEESFETFANLISYACVFFLITYNIKSEKQIKRLTAAILTTSLIVGIYGLLQYFNILRLTPSITIPRRISSTYYNSNHYAGYLAMVAPLPVALFLFSPLSWKTPLFAALSILLIINLALSYSWGSVAFGIALIPLIVMRVKRAKRKVLAASIILSIFIFLAIFGALIMLGPTPQLTQNTYQARYAQMAKIAHPSLFGRLFMYKNELPLILAHPILGTGPGTFIYAFTQFRPLHLNLFWNYAHNDYLQIASEVGLVGLTFFLIFVTITLVKGLSSIRSISALNEINESNLAQDKRRTKHTKPTSHEINETIAIGAWTGILSALLHSLLDGNLSVVPANALHFYSLIGLLIVSTKLMRKEG